MKSLILMVVFFSIFVGLPVFAEANAPGGAKMGTGGNAGMMGGGCGPQPSVLFLCNTERQVKDSTIATMPPNIKGSADAICEYSRPKMVNNMINHLTVEGPCPKYMEAGPAWETYCNCLKKQVECRNNNGQDCRSAQPVRKGAFISGGVNCTIISEGKRGCRQ
ncbi:MAG: hypothetical protein HY537_01165 [Deltaproteobacteria bacterium]|nr:hypothetical protein [Deltaproteobacteria bacterium]